MVAVKNALQAGRPLPTALGVYYRGTVVNAASIAPITAIQFGFSQGLSDALYGDKPPGTLGLLGTSGAAGAVSGFVSGPAEMVMIQQQGARSSGGEIARAPPRGGLTAADGDRPQCRGGRWRGSWGTSSARRRRR